MNKVDVEHIPVYFRHADGGIYHTSHYRTLERLANGEDADRLPISRFKNPSTGEWVYLVRYTPVEVFVSTKEGSTEKYVRHAYNKSFFRTEGNFKERFTALTPEEVEAELH